jgi:hypothetical protein
MKHTGGEGYLSTTARLPDGRSHLDATVDAIAGIVERSDAPTEVAA